MKIAKILNLYEQRQHGILKLLRNNMSNGILPRTDATLQLLKQKHPESREPSPEVLIEEPVRKIYPIVYDDIDKSLILKAAMLTKAGSELSVLMEMDAPEC